MKNFVTSGVGVLILWGSLFSNLALAQRQMEHLDRGLVVVRQDEKTVFLSWRFLGSDPEDMAFHVYRSVGEGKPQKLISEPIAKATCYTDRDAVNSQSLTYSVRPVHQDQEGASSREVKMPAGAPARPFPSIPLKTPEGDSPNDASVGDLDGDGEFEIVLHQAGRGRDNSQSGFTTEPILEAYKLDGTLLWRINLGKDIREGAHYVPFLDYDLDGDGKAEIACKTADGTVDGTGQVIGDSEVDHRSREPRTLGKILKGPEFLTIFEGRTGKALKTTEYIPPRGGIRDWGDDYGNRVDRFLACIAYLDGQHPSLVMCPGYYTRALLAWDWRNGKLTRRWVFDSDDGRAANRAYRGQGNHNLSVGDVDGDGKDEILYGSCVIDDDGTGLYSTGFGHGDAMHFTDIDLQRPGLEIFKANGDDASPAGIELRDAKTDRQLFAKPSNEF